MSKLFGYIFWGLLIVFLDLKINGFDLLPDFVGYALVGVGANGLIQVSQRFGLTGALGWFLAVASAMSIVINGEASTIFDLLVQVVNIAMIWMLLGGVRDYSLEKDRADLAENAYHLRIAWITLAGSVWLFGMLAGHSSGPATLLTAVAAIGMLISMVLILRLVYRARYELAAREDSPRDGRQPQRGS